MELRDTVKMTNSADYKERFIAEYFQTKIRYEKLKAFNTKIEAARRTTYEGKRCELPKHDCPEDILQEQQGMMGQYLHILEIRAEIEGISLDEAEILRFTQNDSSEDDEAVICEKVNKTKAFAPQIIVTGKVYNPCYSILYYDTSDKTWHIGFSSYNLENVVRWKEECFEVVGEIDDMKPYVEDAV